MDFKKERKRIISSSKKALDELDKLITQRIDLAELDPERAKQAAQGKIEAIEGSLKILNVIAEVEDMDKAIDKDEKKDDFFGVEQFAKNK